MGSVVLPECTSEMVRCISSRYEVGGGAVELKPGSPLLTGVMRLPASHVMSTARERERGRERRERGGGGGREMNRAARCSLLALDPGASLR